MLCSVLSWRLPSSPSVYLGLAQCLLWLLLSSPRVCTTVLKRHFDGVLLPILPSLNRSCCHLYFDLCIPWSIYAREIGEGRRWKGGSGGKTTTATMLSTIPQGTHAVHLPFKVFSKRQAKLSSRALQSLVCGSPSHPSPPPESISTVCMFCMLRQKRYSFNCALTLWRGLNGAAHCYGNNKTKMQGKRHKGHYWSFRIQQKWEPSDRAGILHTVWLSCAFDCLCNRQR